MRAENSPVGVYLVDYDEFEVLEKLLPLLVEGVYCHVYHVRVCEDDRGRGFPYLFPSVGARVSVVYFAGPRSEGLSLALRGFHGLVYGPAVGQFPERPSLR